MRLWVVISLLFFFTFPAWAQNVAYIRCKKLKEVSANDKNFELVSLRCGEQVTVVGQSQGKVKIQRSDNTEVTVNPFFVAQDPAVLKGDQLAMDLEVLETKIAEAQRQLQALQNQKAQMEKQLQEIIAKTLPGAVPIAR